MGIWRMKGREFGIVFLLLLFVGILLVDPNVVYPGFLLDFLGNMGQKIIIIVKSDA